MGFPNFGYCFCDNSQDISLKKRPKRKTGEICGKNRKKLDVWRQLTYNYCAYRCEKTGVFDSEILKGPGDFRRFPMPFGQNALVWMV